MPVWQDYVAGTDPTNALSKFTAKIEMKDVDILYGQLWNRATHN